MTMSNPLYFFDVDDMAFGPDAAIFARSDRRFLIKNLTIDQIRWLHSVSRAQSFQIQDIPVGLFSRLAEHDVIRDVRSGSVRRETRRIQLPARWVSSLAAPLTPLTTFGAHAIIMATVLLLLHEKTVALAPIHAVGDWMASMSPKFALIAACTFFLSTIAHELGHAAACLRVTKMTGSIRATTYRGLPALATDVSSVCLASPKGRAAVAISGATTQIAFASLLLFSGSEPVRFGATMAMLAALFVATPLPMTDGYWLLRDLTGFPLKPRLTWRGTNAKVSDIAYGWGLLAMTLLFASLLTYECLQMARRVAPLANESWIRAGLLSSMAAYLAVITIVFTVKNIKLYLEE